MRKFLFSHFRAEEFICFAYNFLTLWLLDTLILCIRQNPVSHIIAIVKIGDTGRCLIYIVLFWGEKNRHEQKIKNFCGNVGRRRQFCRGFVAQKQGYDLVGCYIKGWYPAGVVCNWKEDRRDAMRVCAKLGIPFITVNAEKEYKKEVVDYMLNEYKVGRTPNPDIMCNKSVKFGVFLKVALALGADYIATGHYVRQEPEFPISNFQFPNKFKIQNSKLLQAKDANKDQSYFLWTLTQEQLKYCLFPLGGLLKSEVRGIAKKNYLVTAEKEESQGVCFIGEFNMEDFLKKYIKPKKGKL